MRSTPTQSTEDGGSHHGFRGRRWDRARTGNEEVDMKNVGEVRGACGAPPALVLLSAAAVVAPLPQQPSG
jgi:hypothetical protein